MIIFQKNILTIRNNLKEKLHQDFLRVPVCVYLQKYKSWCQFLKEINGLTEEEKLFSERDIKFLEFLEKTGMTKSYKIPLLPILFKDELKEEIYLKEIGEVL